MQNEEIIAELRNIRLEILTMRKELSRYKGFVGGILWSVSACVTAAGLLSGWIKQHLV